jgi:hypothetical protein
MSMGTPSGSFQIGLVGIVVGLGEKSQVDFKIQGFYQPALGFRLAGIVGYLGQAAVGPVPQNFPQTGIGASG